ncbi:hypothetical protein F5Y13DRAFT_200110 [Hypoxylon sp. FL1857]|nr:hypothetical protein F5Y13DRAFT_200110 [Hypoxylon sp. FL1857]
MASPPPSHKWLSPDQFLALGICLVSVAAIFVTVRVTIGLKKTGRLYADDCLSIIGVLAIAANIALNYEGVIVGSNLDLQNPLPQLRLLYQLGEADIFAFGSVTWLSKAPILLLLIRLFGVKIWLRIIAYVALVVSGLIVLGATSYSAALCDPKGLGGIDFSAQCALAGARGSIIVGFVGLILDLTIFVLPLPVIFRLNLPFNKKLGLAVVFMSGIFAIIASAAGVYFKFRALSGELVDQEASGTMTIVECSITLVAGCAPATYTFWSSVVVNTSLYARSRSMLTKLISTRTGSGESKASRSRNNSHEVYDGTYPTYIRMNTPRKQTSTNFHEIQLDQTTITRP